LISGYYLIVATHRIYVGVINGQVVWSLAGFDIIPYASTLTHLNQTQVIFINTNLLLCHYLIIIFILGNSK